MSGLTDDTITLVTGYSGIVGTCRNTTRDGGWILFSTAKTSRSTTLTTTLTTTLKKIHPGAGIVRALLAYTETTVVAVVRHRNTAECGRQRRLLIVPGIAADGSMEGLPEAIMSVIGARKISHVVSCFGGQAPRKLLSSMDDGDVLASASRSLPHLRLLKAVLPLVDVDRNPTWVFITGMLGERCFMPEKLSGMTLANSMLYGMILAFRAELRMATSQAGRNAIRVLELRIGSMLHKPEGVEDEGKAGKAGKAGKEEQGQQQQRQHPAVPASASTNMKSFSSELVGRLLVDEIERSGMEAADVVRLTDAELERAELTHNYLHVT